MWLFIFFHNCFWSNCKKHPAGYRVAFLKLEVTGKQLHSSGWSLQKVYRQNTNQPFSWLRNATKYVFLLVKSQEKHNSFQKTIQGVSRRLTDFPMPTPLVFFGKARFSQLLESLLEGFHVSQGQVVTPKELLVGEPPRATQARLKRAFFKTQNGFALAVFFVSFPRATGTSPLSLLWGCFGVDIKWIQSKEHLGGLVAKELAASAHQQPVGLGDSWGCFCVSSSQGIALRWFSGTCTHGRLFSLFSTFYIYSPYMKVSQPLLKEAPTITWNDPLVGACPQKTWDQRKPVSSETPKMIQNGKKTKNKPWMHQTTSRNRPQNKPTNREFRLLGLQRRRHHPTRPVISKSKNEEMDHWSRWPLRPSPRPVFPSVSPSKGKCFFAKATFAFEKPPN